MTRRATILTATLLVVLHGCAARAVPSLSPSLSPPLSEAQRRGLGHIGLMVLDLESKAVIAGPMPGGGVGVGIAVAAGGLGLAVLSAAGCFITIGLATKACLFAVTSPYWIGRTTVESAVNALPEGERRASGAAILTAIAEVDAQSFASMIAEEGRPRSATMTVMPPRRAPTEGSATVSYRDAASQGFDFVAEIALTRLSLNSISPHVDTPIGDLWDVDVNPMFEVVAEARLRLVGTADDVLVFEHTYVRRSGRDAKFGEWGRDGAAAFREARDSILKALAWDIAEELFGPVPPSPEVEKLPRCADTPTPAPDEVIYCRP